MRRRALADILGRHLERYPRLRAADIYKLIHQGVFGPGHIIASAAAARRALTGEIVALEVKGQKSKVKRQKADEELTEPIDPSGRLVRVNLGPMQEEVRREKSEGRNRNQSERDRTDVEWLAEVLVESARRVKGDPEQMRRRLSSAVRWTRARLPGQAAELERIAAQARKAGYPALHHSPAYQLAYRPAYRVILSAALRQLRASGRAG
jgi:hypothetical protein